jgi:hypothetical protein
MRWRGRLCRDFHHRATTTRPGGYTRPPDGVACSDYTLPALTAGRASPQRSQLAGGCQFRTPGFSGIASGRGKLVQLQFGQVTARFTATGALTPIAIAASLYPSYVM